MERLKVTTVKHRAHELAEYRSIEAFMANLFPPKLGKKKITSFLERDIKCLSDMNKSHSSNDSGKFINCNEMETYNKRKRLSCRYDSNAVVKHEDSSLNHPICWFTLKMDESKGRFVLHGDFERFLNTKLRLKCHFENGNQKGELALFDVDAQVEAPFFFVKDAVNFDLKRTDIEVDVSLAPNFKEELAYVKSRNFTVQDNSVLSSDGVLHTIVAKVEDISEPDSNKFSFLFEYKSSSGRDPKKEREKILRILQSLKNAEMNDDVEIIDLCDLT